MFYSCNKYKINFDLWNYFEDLANPCNLKLSGTKINIDADIPDLQPFYIHTVYPLTDNVIKGKHILKMLSDQMQSGVAPLIFPFIYGSFVCNNSLHLILQPYYLSLSLIKPIYPVSWWVEVIYQIAKGVEYLESQGINHNNLEPINITFQNYSFDPDQIIMMITEFSKSSTLNFAPGKDMLQLLNSLIQKNLLQPELINELRKVKIYTGKNVVKMLKDKYKI